MIYTTLKANKEHGITDCDIQVYCQEGITEIGYAFGEEYIDDDYCTDFNKLEADFTDRQIANGILKYLRKLSKDKEEPLMIWNKRFIELDCDGVIAYDQLQQLIKDGVITCSNDLRDIDKKARKKGVTIRKDIQDENGYWAYHYVDDIIEEYFPCYAELHDADCNNCGNCH